MAPYSPNLLQHLRTNTDLIFVRKLVLSDELQDQIDALDVNNIPWSIVKLDNDQDTAFSNGYHKIYPVWDNNWKLPVAEEIFNLCVEQFKEIDPDAGIKSVVRVILNLTRLDGTMTDASMHQDFKNLTHWSFIVYLRGTSGTTDFNTSLTNRTVVQTVNFECNKLIAFPSAYAHQGHLSVDNNDRIVLNYVLEIDSEFNSRITEKSSTTLKKQLGVIP